MQLEELNSYIVFPEILRIKVSDLDRSFKKTGKILERHITRNHGFTIYKVLHRKNLHKIKVLIKVTNFVKITYITVQKLSQVTIANSLLFLQNFEMLTIFVNVYWTFSSLLFTFLEISVN